MTRDLRSGWTASVTLHLLLFLIAILFRIPDVVRSSGLIELEWGALSTAPDRSEPARATPTPSVTRSAPTVRRNVPASQRPAERRPALPQRRLPDLSDEALSVPKRDKLDIPGPDLTPERVDRTSGERNDPAAARDQPLTGRTDDRPGAQPGSTGVGSGVDRPGMADGGSGVGYAVQWTGGGTRRRISGNLPKYPEGSDVQAQVRIQAVVLPDGSIRSVQPLQKAGRALEDAAMRELKLWRFEPLPAGVPQAEQQCVVTFLFKLR